jgi:hypothetical protein
MDWRERLQACKAARLQPVYSGETGPLWEDGYCRELSIDWQAERFTYRCSERQRPAAFTPGVAYPLDLLCRASKEDLAFVHPSGDRTPPDPAPVKESKEERRQLTLF